MKVKVNLNKLIVIDKEIDLISEQVEGETTSQGLPIYSYYRDWETDRKSTRLNSSHSAKSRMPSSA